MEQKPKISAWALPTYCKLPRVREQTLLPRGHNSDHASWIGQMRQRTNKVTTGYGPIGTTHWIEREGDCYGELVLNRTSSCCTIIIFYNAFLLSKLSFIDTVPRYAGIPTLLLLSRSKCPDSRNEFFLCEIVLTIHPLASPLNLLQ